MAEINKISTGKISIEKIVEHIVRVRNTRLDEFLKKDEAIMAFLEQHYQTIAISKIKLEFLRRDLNELKNSSLDLVHFSSLIKELKNEFSGQLVQDHPLFTAELDALFKKNGFSLDKA